MSSTFTVRAAQRLNEEIRPESHFGQGGGRGSRGMTGSVVCGNACACMYECVRGKGKHTHTHTGHEGEGGVCS